MTEVYDPVVKGKTSPLAIISLVTGILSILAMLLGLCIPCGFRIIGLILGIAAAIMGFMAKKKIDESMGALGGRGLAIGGLISGLVGAVLCLLLLILGLVGMGLMFNQPGFLEGLDALEGLY